MSKVLAPFLRLPASTGAGGRNEMLDAASNRFWPIGTLGAYKLPAKDCALRLKMKQAEERAFTEDCKSLMQVI
jgi:hypothetical protein